MQLPYEEVVKMGKMSHVGIVVKDMDRAVEYYSSVLGLGPFERSTFEFDDFVYRGRGTRVRVEAGLAQCGEVFIELVHVLEGETPHTDFLREKGEGIQHIAFWVKGLDDILARMATRGIVPVSRYKVPLPPPSTAPEPGKNYTLEMEEAYLDSEGIGGAMVQLMEMRKVPLGETSERSVA